MPQQSGNVFGPLLGEVLSELLRRYGENQRQQSLFHFCPSLFVIVDWNLPERILADREKGQLLQALLAEITQVSTGGPLTIRVGERGRLKDLEGFLRPTYSWLQIQLSGRGMEVSEVAMEDLLSRLQYRKIERITRPDSQSTLSLFWRVKEESSPLVVEVWHGRGEKRISLLFPQVRF